MITASLALVNFVAGSGEVIFLTSKTDYILYNCSNWGESSYWSKLIYWWTCLLVKLFNGDPVSHN